MSSPKEGGGSKRPEGGNENSQRVGGGGSTAQPAAKAYVANNNTSRSVLTLLGQQGYGKGLLSKFPEMGHNYEFMSSPSVKNERMLITRFTRSAGRTRMMHAAYIGDMDRLRELVKKFNADIHIEDNVGLTALAWAAFNGKLRAVQFLVENGAEINRGRNGSTPLFCAIAGNHLTTVRWLCDRGADVNGDKNLELACKDNVSPQLLEFLCERGANVAAVGVNGTPLHALAYSRRTGAEKAEILVSYGASLEAMYTHQTPLLWASESSNVRLVRTLCELGANKEARNNSGMTALMLACHDKIADGTITALCELGANKEERDPEGRTALFYLLDEPNLENVAIALTELLGQDVNIEARFGSKSALDAAVETKVPEAVKILCEHARRKNIELNTPMAAHRVKKQLATYKELLQNTYERHNERVPWGNDNSNYDGEYTQAGISNYKNKIKELEDILKILEKEMPKDHGPKDHGPKAHGSKRETKKGSGPGHNSNNWRSGGGGGGSNSTWWRGGSKRKTRRFKNRV